MAECEGYLEQDLAGRQPQEEEQGRQLAAQVPATHCCRALCFLCLNSTQ